MHLPFLNRDEERRRLRALLSGRRSGLATGAWYSHSAKLCSTGGAFAANDLTPAAGNTYYLIVALSPAVEGSYGTNSSDVEIPQGSGACRALRDLTGCP